MVETIRYGLIGKQDIRRGLGTFEVELADGRIVTLDELGVEVPSSTLALLPLASIGRAAWVTDSLGGLHIGDGGTWNKVYPVINALEMTGTTAGAKIADGISRLPTGGGIIDARGFSGAQTISQDMWSGVASTKPVQIWFGNATYSISVTQAVTAHGTRLVGFSPGKDTDNTGTAFKWTGTSGGTMFTYWGLNYIHVYDLRVLANSLLSTAFQGGQQGANPGNTYGWHFVNVRAPSGQGAVTNGYRAMLDLGGELQTSAKVQDSLFENCAFAGGYAALNVGVSENLFSQFQCDSSTVGAIVQQSASPIFIAPLFTSNTTAIGIEGTIQVNSIRLYSPWFEGGAATSVLKKTDAGASGATEITMHSPKFATGNGTGDLIDLTNIDTTLSIYNARTTGGNDVNILNSANSGIFLVGQVSGSSLTVSGSGRLYEVNMPGTRAFRSTTTGNPDMLHETTGASNNPTITLKTGTLSWILQNTSSDANTPLAILNGTTTAAQLTTDAGIADANTALLIRRNVGGTYTLQQVSMGAVDSGGAGFKVLRVPN